MNYSLNYYTGQVKLWLRTPKNQNASEAELWAYITRRWHDLDPAMQNRIYQAIMVWRIS